jgi:hypothetical protein
MYPPVCRFGLLLLVIATAFGGEGMGIGPALVLIDDVRPGEVIDLGAKGLRYSVQNQSAVEQLFNLEVVTPGAYSLKAFEAGYEPLPDASWLTLEQSSLTVPPKSLAASGVTLHIPDAPEYWNRHYVIYVEAGVGQKVALGATLRVRARLLIETAVQANDAAPKGSVIVVTPGRIDLTPIASSGWQGQATVRNQGPQATFDVLTLAAVYPAPVADRRPRFFPGHVVALPDEGQVSVDVTSFTLKTGEQQKLNVTSAAAAVVGDNPVDAVRFIGRRALSTAGDDVREVGGQRYDRIELLRLRHPLKETAKAP